jgi:hypothetical protein
MRRVAELAGLIAHTTGGRPAGRLMTRLGMPQSKDSLLRSLKRSAPDPAAAGSVRFVGVDDLSSVLQFSLKVGLENSLIGISCGSFRRG